MLLSVVYGWEAIFFFFFIFGLMIFGCILSEIYVLLAVRGISFNFLFNENLLMAFNFRFQSVSKY